MKSKYINTYMKMAEELAKLSSAKRLQVGAIAIRDNRIILCGYNGTASGCDNCCEDVLPDGSTRTKPEVIHAEQNIIFFAAKYGVILEGCDIILTHSPCMECAKGIKQAGIKSVYYKTVYRDTSGIDLLKKLNVNVVQVPQENNNNDQNAANVP